jgi:hypothetical protein
VVPGHWWISVTASYPSRGQSQGRCSVSCNGKLLPSTPQIGFFPFPFYCPTLQFNFLRLPASQQYFHPDLHFNVDFGGATLYSQGIWHLTLDPLGLISVLPLTGQLVSVITCTPQFFLSYLYMLVPFLGIQDYQLGIQWPSNLLPTSHHACLHSTLSLHSCMSVTLPSAFLNYDLLNFSVPQLLKYLPLSLP